MDRIVSRIAGLASLAGRDGDSAFVLSVLSPWTYVTGGAQFVVDHITVESTADGGNTRWLRDDEYASPSWRKGDSIGATITTTSPSPVWLPGAGGTSGDATQGGGGGGGGQGAYGNGGAGGNC